MGELLRGRMSDLGISLTELASRCGEHVQTVSSILNGRREVPISLSVRMDSVLGFDPGYIALAQVRHQVAKELEKAGKSGSEITKKRILRKIKDAGGFWSYKGIPENMDDDSIIEAALVYMELEDLPLLFRIWSKSHIKRVWKERLVSQGKRMNILNYILAVKVFKVNNPDNYIARYA